MPKKTIVNPANALQRIADLEFLVKLIAGMDTPTDDITDKERRDDIMAELDDERLCSDASALYAIIRKARELMQ